MKGEIEKALQELIGTPMWGSSRAVDMEMFAFGAPHTTAGRQGRIVTRGEFALHVQCAWRIVRGSKIAVGSHDFRYPRGDPMDEPADFQPHAPGANRRDVRLETLFKERSSDPLVVRAVAADDTGRVTIAFQDDYALELFPDDSLETEGHSERWRLLRPDTSKPHFVVTGGGIEIEETNP